MNIFKYYYMYKGRNKYRKEDIYKERYCTME